MLPLDFREDKEFLRYVAMLKSPFGTFTQAPEEGIDPPGLSLSRHDLDRGFTDYGRSKIQKSNICRRFPSRKTSQSICGNDGHLCSA